MLLSFLLFNLFYHFTFPGFPFILIFISDSFLCDYIFVQEGDRNIKDHILELRCKRLAAEDKLEALANLVQAGRGISYVDLQPVYMSLLQVYSKYLSTLSIPSHLSIVRRTRWKVYKIELSANTVSFITCRHRLYILNPREKFEPGLGFEPWTSSSLAWCSTTWAILVQLTVQV